MGKKNKVPGCIQMFPCGLQDRILIAVDIRNGDHQNAARRKAFRGLLDHEPRVSQVFERVPESDDIELLVHLSERCGGIGGLHRPDSDRLVQEVDAVLINFEGGDIESGVSRVATEDADPRTDLQQLSRLACTSGSVSSGSAQRPPVPATRQERPASVDNHHVKRHEIGRNGIHEDKAAVLTLVIVKNCRCRLPIAIGRRNERTRSSVTIRTTLIPVTLCRLACGGSGCNWGIG